MINTVVTIRNPQNPILIIKAPTLRPAHSEKQSDGLEWLKRAQRSCQRSSGVFVSTERFIFRVRILLCSWCMVFRLWLHSLGLRGLRVSSVGNSLQTANPKLQQKLRETRHHLPVASRMRRSLHPQSKPRATKPGWFTVDFVPRPEILIRKRFRFRVQGFRFRV